MKIAVKLKIGAKLIGLIATLLLVSTVALVGISNRLFVDDNTALIQQMNSDTAANLAAQVREMFGNINDKTRLVGSLFFQEFKKPDARGALVRDLFATDTDYLGFFLHEGADRPSLRASAVSPQLKEWNPAADAYWVELLESGKNFSIQAALKGSTQVTSVKLTDGNAAIGVAIPFIRSAADPTRFSHVVTALVKQTRFAKVFAENDIVTSYMVDSGARYLAHPNTQLVLNGDSAGHLDIVSKLLEGKFNNGQTSYTDPVSHEARLGAFRMVGFGGLGIVAEVPEAKALEAPRRVQFRAMLVALVILSIAFLVGYFYSDTITWPIQQLVHASRRISAGDFKVRLTPRSQDEVGELAVAFNDMASGLEERERVKATFNKFHNKEIAEKLLSGDVRLGGERREAVIFFSDIRGFTSLSETLQPEQVVEMLNEYMTRMVSVIRKNGGIVDKYVGDAIMALWGVPLDNPDACFNAVSACIEMRVELAKLNESRIGRGLPPLRIGMGLNCGQVIAGNIGSDEKMEYTVIGDSVNLASRIESMTKEFGTDLLIAKTVRDKVTDRFVFEACSEIKVKGKTNAIEAFKVLGYLKDGKPTMVMTPYSDYEAEKSDKVVHGTKAA